jgi:hypothetical protein
MKRPNRLTLWALALSLAWIGVTPVFAAAADVLLFSFFRGNGEKGVYLAWSEDGVNFEALNGDQPVMPPADWPKQNLTRDPSIIHRDGKFRLVWTSNWDGRVFGYAESTDLKTWSAPVKVQPFPASLPEPDQPANVWAPEIHWDPIQKNYLIIWSTTTPREGTDGDGSSDRGGDDAKHDHRTYACRTVDGKTFTEARLFFDQGFSVIDAFLALDDRGTVTAADDQWVMVVKHEQEVARGGKNLRLTTAPADFSRPWAPIGQPVFGPGSPIRPKEMVEGASLLRWQGQWFLYTDAFANGHYSMASSPDLKNWTDRTTELRVPAKARHGTIFTAPRAAVGWLAPKPQ